ncbi:MAG: AtpZ/AtpI family protein [Planctomycetota bacterium]|jgi:F0F1-type ATP synthase assembly protein I
MPNNARDSRLALAAELSQVGLEMAAPIGLGALIDYWGGWTFPVAAIVGAVIGLVGGIFHLVVLANREAKLDDDEAPDKAHKDREGPP